MLQTPPLTASAEPRSVELLSRFDVGDTALEYHVAPTTGTVGLRLYPSGLRGQLVERQEWLLDFEHKRMGESSPRLRAWSIDSLVQVKCIGDDYPTGFSQGSSLRNSSTTLELRYHSQEVTRRGEETLVTTLLRDSRGCVAEHYASWHDGDSQMEMKTVYRNESDAPITLELLSSFSLGDITPFHGSDAPHRLRIHRLRSAWSAEGRLETRRIEELNLERSWQDHAVRCERFGQVGSLPVKGFFPFAAIEDTEAGVCWGAQIAWAGSWQMEFYRQGAALCLSGGLADREFGHWTKCLKPGDKFETPPAVVACIAGSLDDLCHRLTERQRRAADQHPSSEATLPIVCNEFCTSWGSPTHENIEALARRLKGSLVRYLVIDAGWYGQPGDNWWNQQGTWFPSAERFPHGLSAISEMIRSYGMVPGLWFEMEVVGTGSTAFTLTDHQLKRDGVPITTTKRHFWDFRDPWVHEYLAKRVIAVLRDGNFGYAKFDYNESIGIGVDGAESLGEGLRQHIEGVTRFFDRIRAELPGLVIECCSSGGHRLEPSMIARSAMSSFSDAHESLEIPIIAANLHRVMLPRQSQIWAVLRPQDNESRMIYSLASTFLGRLCLSGQLHDLTESQWNLATHAMEFYGRVAPIIKNGRSHRFGPVVQSYRYPTGWQGILRVGAQNDSALLIVHSFERRKKEDIRIPLTPAGDWRLEEVFSATGADFEVEHDAVTIKLTGDFEAAVVLLKRS